MAGAQVGSCSCELGALRVASNLLGTSATNHCVAPNLDDSVGGSGGDVLGGPGPARVSAEGLADLAGGRHDWKERRKWTN